MKQAVPLGVIAAALFSTFLAVFAFNSIYENIVLLYGGNLLFATVVLIGIIRLNAIAHNNAPAVPLFRTGWQITLIGVIVSTLAAFILYLLQDASVPTKNILPTIPVEQADKKIENLTLTIFVHAIFINALVGVLATIIGSGVVKRNQKTMKGKDSNSGYRR